MMLWVLSILWAAHIPLSVNFALHKSGFEKLADRVMAEASKTPAVISNLSGIGSVQQSPELNQALAELVSKRAALRTTLQQYTPEHRNSKLLISEIEKYEQEILPALAESLGRQNRLSLPRIVKIGVNMGVGTPIRW